MAAARKAGRRFFVPDGMEPSSPLMIAEIPHTSMTSRMKKPRLCRGFFDWGAAQHSGYQPLLLIRMKPIE